MLGLGHLAKRREALGVEEAVVDIVDEELRRAAVGRARLGERNVAWVVDSKQTRRCEIGERWSTVGRHQAGRRRSLCRHPSGEGAPIAPILSRDSYRSPAQVDGPLGCWVTMRWVTMR